MKKENMENIRVGKMEEMEKINVSMEKEKMSSSDLDLYMHETIVLIGSRMDKVFRSLIKTNSGRKNAILYITQKKEDPFVSKVAPKYEDFHEEAEESFVSVTDLDGNIMDEKNSASRISFPEVMQVHFKHLESDREIRRASEIVSGIVDNTWVTIIGSDLAEGFARNIHSSLVYRRKKFNNAVASFVFTSTENVNEEFNLKVLKNNIKNNTNMFKEIKSENRLKKTIFQKKSEDQEIEKMIFEISSLQKAF
ncbi:MAG: hypothetical protein ACYCSO_03920 [Cuniculiplasma sp.]